MGRHYERRNEAKEKPQQAEAATSIAAPSAAAFVECNLDGFNAPATLAVESEMSHAVPTETGPETTPEATRTICQYCGITTNRVKSHERHCSLRTHEKTG